MIKTVARILEFICYLIPIFTVATIKNEHFKELVLVSIGLSICSSLFKIWSKNYKLHLNVILILLLITTFFIESHFLIKFYPVIVNLTLFSFFAASLSQNKTPVIEYFARKQEKFLTNNKIHYCRKLTVYWSVFFLVNVAISLYISLQSSDKFWLIYNSFISYAIVFTAIAIEILLRKTLLKKWLENDQP